MSLINTIMANTKSENIQNTSGDPFWEKSRDDISPSLILLYIKTL